MTAPERAVYLIENLGHEKAIEHAEWVRDGAYRTITREYWEEVANEIRNNKLAPISTPIVECKK